MPVIDLKNDLVCAIPPDLVVACRLCLHQRAARIAVTSTSAVSSGPRKPCRDLAEVHFEIVHLATIDLSASNRIGIVGQAKNDALGLGQCAVQLGTGGSAVHTLIENGSPASCVASIRWAGASGTALGWPEPVKPLMPTVVPGAISLAGDSDGSAVFRRTTRTEVCKP